MGPALQLLLAASLVAAPEDTERLGFNRDVRPVLSNHCFECHGPDEAERKADLRLDRAEGLADVVVAGEPGDSELVRRVTTDDAAEQMPPAGFRHELDERERELLVRWVREGAEFEDHWSYRAPERGPGPTGEGDPIDRHLQEALAQAGIEPAPEAGGRTLLRRLTQDLTGLPPTPEEMEAFLADPGPGAYGRAVERLLASPHHAERLTQHWLDLVRYADTVGYHGDQQWTVWPYRDWVLRSFAENRPFDEFTVHQLAGDLLPDAGLDEQVAATYCRLNMVTFEGGSQAKEFLAKYAADRVRTTSTVWLGSTVGCAECHDHKFDPFSTRDFYRLAAYFADISEVGVYQRFQDGYVPPQLAVPTAEQAAELAALDGRIAAQQGALDAAAGDLGEERRAWEAQVRAGGGRGDATWVDDHQGNGGETQGTWTFVDEPRRSGERSRRQQGGGIVQHFFFKADRKVTVQEGDRFFAWILVDPATPPETVMIQLHAGNWEHRMYWGADKISFGGIGQEAAGHRHGGPLPAAGEWFRLEVDPERVGLPTGTVVDGMAFTQFGGLAHWDVAGVTTEVPALAFDGPPAELLPLLTTDAERTQEQEQALAQWFGTIAPSLQPLRDELARSESERVALDKGLPRIPATVATTPRMMRVLPRGNWMDDSGEVVTPGTPHFLPAVGEGPGAGTRLELARWLVSPDNPLTARVVVNRYWRMLFGDGLAADVDDLGSQGAWPANQALLDELALDFVESGWDVRALIRRLVHTRAYRRMSVAHALAMELDPENLLVGRQGRWRLDAEFVRDAALASSGLLVREVGGPSVKPYQPAGYWAHLNFPMRTWQHDGDTGQYRRGMYTFWCRTFLHPSLKAFDAPAREESCARRLQSNTPLQALTLLNDPTYVEAARALAARTLEERVGDGERLERAFQLVLQRTPSAQEVRVLERVLANHRDRYRDAPDGAAAVARNGQLLAASDQDAVEVASWTAVARVLLNLGEAITRR